MRGDATSADLATEHLGDDGLRMVGFGQGFASMGAPTKEWLRLIALHTGSEVTADDDPYRLLDGTAGRQTVLRIGDGPSTEVRPSPSLR